ncbi:hypothetical protein [Candidatus Spongiihabitans sp.]|uniref:hypothetical protein n=1 Tax=Candidatus Spongiihabitans sp. TaxID=3101308 RepID=UPI003C6F9B21
MLLSFDANYEIFLADLVPTGEHGFSSSYPPHIYLLPSMSDKREGAEDFIHTQSMTHSEYEFCNWIAGTDYDKVGIIFLPHI